MQFFLHQNNYNYTVLSINIYKLLKLVFIISFFQEKKGDPKHRLRL
jgi:hypothetical protein